MSKTAMIEALTSFVSIIPVAIATPFQRWHDSNHAAEICKIRLRYDHEENMAMIASLNDARNSRS